MHADRLQNLQLCIETIMQTGLGFLKYGPVLSTGQENNGYGQRQRSVVALDTKLNAHPG